MYTRHFTLVMGIIFVIFGVLGFVPEVLQAPPPDIPRLSVEGGYGLLFGLFPVNVFHNLVHLVVGVLGLAAYRSLSSSLLFARGLAVFYGLLAVASDTFDRDCA
jgi:hypothetical protein